MPQKVYKIRRKSDNTWSNGMIPPKFVSNGGQNWRSVKGVKKHIERVRLGKELYDRHMSTAYGNRKNYKSKDLADFYGNCEIVTFKLKEVEINPDLADFLNNEVKSAMLKRIK